MMRHVTVLSRHFLLEFFYVLAKYILSGTGGLISAIHCCHSSPVRMQNIMINPYVCESVCPQAYFWNSLTDLIIVIIIIIIIINEFLVHLLQSEHRCIT